MNRPDHKIELIRTSKSVVFHAIDYCSLSVPLPVTVPSAEVIDRVIQICFVKPEYLRQEDAWRHITLLRELKGFLAAQIGEDLPVSELGWPLERWVESYLFDENAHPLLSSYALDTAVFVVAHTQGYYSPEPEWWEIEGIVDCSNSDKPRFGFQHERQFKKRFTEKMSPMDVLARVPRGCSVTSRKDIEVIPADTNFAFEIHRCHLSESVEGSYNIHLFCNEPNSPHFDLGQDFQFTGCVLVLCRGSYRRHWCPPEQEITSSLASHPKDWEEQRELNRVGMALPARWITHVLRDDPYIGEIPKAILVPDWKSTIQGFNSGGQKGRS